MYNISVCGGCGRTIDSKFIYCPWCGFSKIENGKDVSLEDMFLKYEETRKAMRRKQLYEMEKELDELENELSVLVLSAEMHK